jgi:hypothetical protein
MIGLTGQVCGRRVGVFGCAYLYCDMQNSMTSQTHGIRVLSVFLWSQADCLYNVARLLWYV